MRLAVLILALTAGPVAAQGMDCRAVGGGRMVCTESFRSLTDRIDRRTQGREAAENPSLTPAQRRLVADVAKAVRAGRCEQARTLAIQAGDYPLADQAGRLCSKSSPAGGGGA